MRKYEYRMWDKETVLKGREPSEWLRLHPHLKDGKVFIVNIDGEDAEIHTVGTARSLLDMGSATDEEVIQQFIDNLINDREQEPVYIQKNTELKKELYQAKLTMMKEGLI